jgi:hypothetical protein
MTMGAKHRQPLIYHVQLTGEIFGEKGKYSQLEVKGGKKKYRVKLIHER